MTRVLLTSFEPFGGQALNSSLEIGRTVAERPPAGAIVGWLVLPVVAGLCVDRAWERVVAFGPELVLALGQSESRAGLHFEARAVNVADFRIPDNAGNQPCGEPVHPGGPQEYAGTFPADRVVEALAGRAVPVALSFSAGTYVCNHLYYGLLHRAAATGRPHATGFIYVPLLPSQRGPDAGPGPTLEELADAVRLIIAACLEQVRRKK